MMENTRYVDPVYPARDVDSIINHVLSHQVQTPVQLGVKVVRVCNGGQSHLMRFYIAGEDVTLLVAKALGLTISKSKRAPGAAIVHGCGMDMCFHCSNNLYLAAFRAGQKRMFDEIFYKEMR